jgi:hypothetical protein
MDIDKIRLYRIDHEILGTVLSQKITSLYH